MARKERVKMAGVGLAGAGLAVAAGIGARAVGKRFKLQPPIVRAPKPAAPMAPKPPVNAGDDLIAKEAAYEKWLKRRADNSASGHVSAMEKDAIRRHLGIPIP